MGAGLDVNASIAARSVSPTTSRWAMAVCISRPACIRSRIANAISRDVLGVPDGAVTPAA
jgi:hypothetical protein